MSFTKCTLLFCVYFLDWDDVPPSSALEEISEEEAVQILADPLLPLQSSTLRDYVDHSETLTKLVQLGMRDFVCVVSLCLELWSSCSLCFDLSDGFVNLKISSYRSSDYCYRQQNIMQGEWKKRKGGLAYRMLH